MIYEGFYQLIINLGLRHEGFVIICSTVWKTNSRQSPFGVVLLPSNSVLALYCPGRPNLTSSLLPGRLGWWRVRKPHN